MSVSISFKIDPIKYKNQIGFEVVIIFQLVALALHNKYSQHYFVEAYTGSRNYQPLPGKAGNLVVVWDEFSTLS